MAVMTQRSPGSVDAAKLFARGAWLGLFAMLIGALGVLLLANSSSGVADARPKLVGVVMATAVIGFLISVLNARESFKIPDFRVLALSAGFLAVAVLFALGLTPAAVTAEARASEIHSDFWRNFPRMVLFFCLWPAIVLTSMGWTSIPSDIRKMPRVQGASLTAVVLGFAGLLGLAAARLQVNWVLTGADNFAAEWAVAGCAYLFLIFSVITFFQDDQPAWASMRSSLVIGLLLVLGGLAAMTLAEQRSPTYWIALAMVLGGLATAVAALFANHQRDHTLRRILEKDAVTSSALALRPGTEREVLSHTWLSAGGAAPARPLLTPEAGSSSQTWRIRVFLAEEQEIYRTAFRSYLETNAVMDLIGSASDASGPAFIEAVASARPEVLLIGLKKLDTSAVEQLERIRERSPKTGLVVLAAAYDTWGFSALRDFAQAIGSGCALLRKDTIENPRQLTGVIFSVAEGRVILDPFVMERLVASADSGASILQEFTAQEVEILAWMAKGYRDEAIGGVLNLSAKALERRLLSIFGKLGKVPESKDARVYAIRLYLHATGQVTPGPSRAF